MGVMGRLAAMANRYEEWAEVHDAVADLIEAATHVDALSIQSVAHGRLRAALARVQGGAK